MIDLIGDLHIKKENLDKQGILFSQIEASSNKYVILTGDLLDTKSIVRSECLNFLYEKLSSSSKEFYIVVGNHDQHSVHTLEHSLEPLKELSNVTIIDSLMEFDIEGLSIVGIPYIHSQEEFSKLIRSVRSKKDKVLICHQGFSGFDYGNGYIAKDEGDLKLVSAFHRVFIGHFHKFSEFNNGCYIGTPFSQSFGESNQTKYVGIINKFGGLELVKTQFPRHITVELDCDKDEVPYLIPTDYNRVILKGTPDAISQFDKSSLKDVKVINKPILETTQEGLEISENLSNVEKFKAWADSNKSLEEATVTLGVLILKEVR